MFGPSRSGQIIRFFMYKIAEFGMMGAFPNCRCSCHFFYMEVYLPKILMVKKYHYIFFGRRLSFEIKTLQSPNCSFCSNGNLMTIWFGNIRVNLKY